MCGRYTQRQKKEIVTKMLGIEKVIGEISTSFNVAPGQDVAAVVGHSERRLGLLRWGLPSLRAGDRPLINARAETLREKPTFARLLAKRRCLIVADGFYEWQQVEGRKQPVFIRMKDDTPFVFAGLWDSSPQEDGQEKAFCAIITTAANTLISPVHHRMPVILPPSAIDPWLDPRYRAPESLLKPYPDDAMTWYPVSDAVNSPRNDGPELVQPLS